MICTRRILCLIAPAALAVAGCSSKDGIDPGGEVYSGIAPDADLTLLGTEPFWNVEIVAKDEGEGEGYLATYTTPENLEGTSFTATRFAGNNGLGFSGEMDGRTVVIALTPGLCSDGMSDRSYPFTVTAEVDDRTLYGCGYSSDNPFSGEETP